MGAFIPVLPSAGGTFCKALESVPNARLLRQTAALGLLVQGLLGEGAGEGLFQMTVGREVAEGGS